MRPEEVERRAVGHGGRDGDHLSIAVRQLHQRVGEDLRVGAPAQRLGLAGLGIVRPQAVKLLLLLQRRLEAPALLRQHVQQHRPILLLEKLESLDQRGDVVPVERPVSTSARILRRCTQGHSMPLAASSALRAMRSAVLPPSFSTSLPARSCRWS